MIQQNKGDIHLFTTNHPWFLEIGLSSFTTGTLIDWWNQKTADGRYLNRRHINRPISPSDPLSDAPNGLDKLLGISTTTEFFWDGWKPNREIPNAGRFKKQNLRGASGNTGGTDADKWEYKGKKINNAMMMNSLKDSEILYAMGLNGTTLVPHYNVPENSVNNPSTLLKVIKPLYGLIQLNKWMVIYQNYFPRKLWNQQFLDLYEADWALLTEIKFSKAGSYLQWSGPVKFYVDDGVFSQCEIEENIFFNLYLGNESMMKSGNNAITIKNLTIVGPKVNAIGTNPVGDGERSDPNATDTAAQTAAPLDVQYNPATKKWQSGNKNILAKLTTDLKRAANSPTLSRLLSNDIAEDANEPNNKYSFIPSSGLAMPITAPDSMGFQHSAIYELTIEARCSSTALPAEKNKKIIVPVYNFNTVREYKAGTDVLLTEMDGKWHVSSLGEANAEATEVAKTSVGKWGAFTYMATSSNFFFKAKKADGTTVSVTPRSAELNFHKLFYKYRGGSDHPLNSDTDYGAAGGYDSVSFNTLTHEEWTDEPGWFQTTSFDYLDSQIFGIRGKDGTLGANGDLCSISSTSATVNAAGNPIPHDDGEYANRNSAHTGTFFGCVFPAGYKGTQVYDDVNRSWIVGSTGTGSAQRQSDFFDTNTNNNTNINPFDPSPVRNNSNAKCDATFTDPTGAPSKGNGWSRGSDKPDASLFYLGATFGRRTIPADVMLNASPSGKYGSPINPIGTMVTGMNKIWVNGHSNTWIADLVNDRVWLHKIQTPLPEGSTKNPNDSAFDFQPMKPDNLMFRPLKLEGYLQFGLPKYAFYEYGGEGLYAESLTLDFVQKFVGGFYAEAARTQMDNTFPISYYAVAREQNNCSDNIIEGALKWGGWVKNKPDYSNGKRLHDAGYWNSSNGGMQWTHNILNDGEDADWRGAGAFGVITTSNKVTANESIKFTTKSLYGMSSAGGRPPLDGRLPDQTKSWGISNFSDSYKEQNIIDLSVRIYQGHDSLSTVYDPRYFAVHHFNPGVESLGVETRPTGQVVFTDLRDSSNNILPSVTYNYKQARGVDVKIPSTYETSSHVNGGQYSPTSLSNGNLVFSDATYTTEPSPQIMSEKYWNVDTRRTGKLLPYRYKVLTMTIPIDTSLAIVNMTNESSSTNLDQTALSLSDRLIVKNFGLGYKKGDIVGITELDILLEVVTTDPSDGAITGLKVKNAGENLPSSFGMPLKSNGNLSLIRDLKGLTPKYKVKTIALIAGSTGKDFDAYFVCAMLKEKIKCDPKPFLIKKDGAEIVRIAADESGPSVSTPSSTKDAEGASYVNKTKEVTFNLDGIDNIKSADSTYDIFFHFHNDITMTWLACGSSANGKPHGDLYNPTESIEQHITIESINLT